MKYKGVITRTLSYLNYIEGYVHIVVALIGFWGCIDNSLTDIRVLLPNVENMIFGVFSILTGFVLQRFTFEPNS